MQHSKANLYLMELMIAILFFAISSTVCIQLFVKAHLLNEETFIRNQAVLVVQNTAEYFLASAGNKEMTLSYYDDYKAQNNDASVFFDDTFTPCKEEQAMYEEQMSFSSDSDYSYVTLNLYDLKNRESHYTLSLKKNLTGGLTIEKE